MPSRSRFFDRTLPLAVGGAIDFGNAFQLVAKSRRSALVLAAVWWPAKLLGAVQGECAAVEKLLKRWGAFKPNEKLTGSLIYKPLDFRRRSYMIGIGETRSYFAKVGPDVGIEALAKKVELQLESAGFFPQLPISRHRYDESWINLYHYFHSTEMTKVRLNLAQTSAFIEAMNTGNSKSRCVTLQSFLSSDKKQKAAYAAQILKYEKLESGPINLFDRRLAT